MCSYGRLVIRALSLYSTTRALAIHRVQPTCYPLSPAWELYAYPADTIETCPLQIMAGLNKNTVARLCGRHARVHVCACIRVCARAHEVHQNADTTLAASGLLLYALATVGDCVLLTNHSSDPPSRHDLFLSNRVVGGETV